MCSPSKTRCSYTSSETTSRSCSQASAAIPVSSARVNTAPVGLCGVFSSRSRVRGVIAARSASEVGAEPGRPQGDRDPGGARHGHAGGVGVVVGLERDGLVARLEERDQRGGDRLGGARGDQDLAVGVDVHAVEALLVGGDRVPQLGNARARRVLVTPPFQDRRGGRGGDLGRAVGVREALAEVDRPGRQGQRRHLGEDRRAHAGQPAVQQWSVHTAMRSHGRGRPSAGQPAPAAPRPCGLRCAHADADRARPAAGQPGPGGEPHPGPRGARGRRPGRGSPGRVPGGDPGPVRHGPAGRGRAAGRPVRRGAGRRRPRARGWPWSRGCSSPRRTAGSTTPRSATTRPASGSRRTARSTCSTHSARRSPRWSPRATVPVVADLAGLRVGLLTCYDIRFPELARSLVAQGADLLVVPAAWAAGLFKEEHWVTLVRARAIENTVWVAAAGQVPDPESPRTRAPTGIGRSMLVDPMGTVRLDLGPLPGGGGRRGGHRADREGPGRAAVPGAPPRGRVRSRPRAERRTRAARPTGQQARPPGTGPPAGYEAASRRPFVCRTALRRLSRSSSLTRSTNRIIVMRSFPPERRTSAISRASCSSRDSAGQ